MDVCKLPQKLYCLGWLKFLSIYLRNLVPYVINHFSVYILDFD